MYFVITLVLLTILIFINSLYYSLSLLLFIVTILFTLVSTLHMTTLTMIILCIVYIGAIMILIGYICAICPNIMIVSSLNSPMLLVLSALLLSLYFDYVPFTLNSSSSLSMVEFFYSSSGLFTFFILVFILFITLLIVTSQYLTPNGPFRSVSA